MATTVHRTCTLCEATCGLTFQVDGDRILSVRPDPQDPISKGYVCPKGIAMADPRRSETAREADERIAIRPGTDAALLLAMAAVIVRDGHANAAAIAQAASGWDEIERRLRALDLERVARATGVATERIVRLATEFAERPSSVAYSRVGVCNSQFGTLGTFATDLLNLVAGLLGAVGGAMFPSPAIDITPVTRQKGMDGQGRWHTRVRL